jgi:hypothetical protein
VIFDSATTLFSPLALGGFPSVGELTLVIGFVVFQLPTASQRLQGPATAAVSPS